MIRDLNRLSDGVDESNQNSARRKLGLLGRSGSAMRAAGRLIGPINVALTIMDNVVPSGQDTWDTSGTAWRQYRKCANPNPAYNLGWSALVRSGLNEQASLHDFTDGCLSGQAVPADGLFAPWNPAFVTNSYRSVALGKTLLNPGPSYRGQLQVSFVRPNASTAAPYPTFQAAAAAYALPRVPDTTWPITAFPDEFAPLVTPAYTDAIPWALATQPKEDNANNRPLPSVQPSRQLNAWSVAITSPSPNGGMAGKPPKYHDQISPNQNPDRGDKERKLKAGPALTKVLRYIGHVTEAADFVDAIYDALPSQYRPRYKNTKYEKQNVSYREKLQALYDHWDKVEVDQAVYNLIYENAMDRVWGEIGKAGAQVSKNLGHHHGAGINSLTRRMWNLTRP